MVTTSKMLKKVLVGKYQKIKMRKKRKSSNFKT